jgi:hypothetical protein
MGVIVENAGNFRAVWPLAKKCANLLNKNQVSRVNVSAGDLGVL